MSLFIRGNKKSRMGQGRVSMESEEQGSYHFWSRIVVQTGLCDQGHCHDGKTSHPAATNLAA
ncbi:hypothetical protein B7P43_G18154 [Cryptotermes secundus]|uniref:Uncharacterized protein n=1 Tax=Cryptotermes secundus TaxID=105785 RepID=A0A2J7QCQ2_9NEOP|nr:hypothetical protein B7P43_G18154 [Cryptotermes secundus]